MARGRWLSPDFFDSTTLARCSHSARLLFAALLQCADRAGVFEWDERKVRKYAFGYDDITQAQFDGWLHELWAGGFIKRADWEGKRYGFIPTMPERQQFHRDEKPKYTAIANGATWLAPCEHGASMVPLALRSETGDLRSETGDLRSETGDLRSDLCLAPPEIAAEVRAEVESRGGEMTAPPSAPAVAKKKRNPEQEARSIEINRRYRELYESREGHPPAGVDQQFNGIVAKFSDKYADAAMAILEWFFDSPDPYFKRSGWLVTILFDQAPRLWRELNDKRKAVENLAAPAQSRQLSLAANNELSYQEYLRRKEQRGTKVHEKSASAGTDDQSGPDS